MKHNIENNIIGAQEAYDAQFIMLITHDGKIKVLKNRTAINRQDLIKKLNEF